MNFVRIKLTLVLILTVFGNIYCADGNKKDTQATIDISSGYFTKAWSLKMGDMVSGYFQTFFDYVWPVASSNQVSSNLTNNQIINSASAINGTFANSTLNSQNNIVNNATLVNTTLDNINNSTNELFPIAKKTMLNGTNNSTAIMINEKHAQIPTFSNETSNFPLLNDSKSALKNLNSTVINQVPSDATLRDYVKYDLSTLVKYFTAFPIWTTIETWLRQIRTSRVWGDGKIDLQFNQATNKIISTPSLKLFEQGFQAGKDCVNLGQLIADVYDTFNNLSREELFPTLFSFFTSLLANGVTFEIAVNITNYFVPGSSLLLRPALKWAAIYWGIALPTSLVAENIATYFGVKDCKACKSAWEVGSDLSYIIPYVIPQDYSFTKNLISTHFA